MPDCLGKKALAKMQHLRIIGLLDKSKTRLEMFLSAKGGLFKLLNRGYAKAGTTFLLRPLLETKAIPFLNR